LKECRDACWSKPSCFNFVYGHDDKDEHCYYEKTKNNYQCEEGFESNNNYNYYHGKGFSNTDEEAESLGNKESLLECVLAVYDKGYDYFFYKDSDGECLIADTCSKDCSEKPWGRTNDEIYGDGLNPLADSVLQKRTGYNYYKIKLNGLSDQVSLRPFNGTPTPGPKNY
jgi:hypothetical protein